MVNHNLEQGSNVSIEQSLGVDALAAEMMILRVMVLKTIMN